MRVRIIKWGNVVEHVKNDAIMLNAFAVFYAKLKKCEWKNPGDVLKSFNSADIINCAKMNRIIFNVRGTKYRMVCGYKFGQNSTILFVKFIGTHSAYDKIDVYNENMFK